MSAESCEAEKNPVFFCSKETSQEGKKLCKRSLERRKGWDSCYLNMNIALTLHHTEVNIWVSPCVLSDLIFSFDTYSQMEWAALWKFLLLSTGYRESLNSSAADNYTEALTVAEAIFNAPSEAAETVLMEIRMGSKLTLWTPTPWQNCAATHIFHCKYLMQKNAALLLLKLHSSSLQRCLHQYTNVGKAGACQGPRVKCRAAFCPSLSAKTPN